MTDQFDNIIHDYNLNNLLTDFKISDETKLVTNSVTNSVAKSVTKSVMKLEPKKNKYQAHYDKLKQEINSQTLTREANRIQILKKNKYQNENVSGTHFCTN